MYNFKQWTFMSLALVFPHVLAGSQAPVFQARDDFDVFKYIDPFIGTTEGGTGTSLLCTGL
jgi:hypothetical protein